MSEFNLDSIRLTEAGEATLNEYVEHYRRSVLEEAVKLYPAEKLNARDIVNTVEALEARLNHPPTSHAFERRREFSQLRLISILSITAVLAVAASAVTLLGAGKPQGSDSFWVPMSVGLAAMASILTAALAMSARLWRSSVELNRAQPRATLVRRIHPEAGELLANTEGSVNRESFEFLTDWDRIERRLRTLAQFLLRMPEEDAKYYPIGPLLDQLGSLKVIDYNDSEAIRTILHARNAIVHGERLTESELSAARSKMRSLSKTLDGKPRATR